jgi:hypothetical protein
MVCGSRVGSWLAVSAALLLVSACCGNRSRCCPCPCAVTTSAVPASTTGAPTKAGVGTLSLSSDPAGEVEIDGKPAGTTPLRLDLSAGKHDVRVRLGGFEEWSRDVDVRANDRSEVVAQLVARDVEDRQVLQMLARRAKVWLQPYEPPATLRSAGGAASVVAVYPRGAVRVADLDELRLDFPTAPLPGEVRFVRGDEVISRTSVDDAGTGAWVRPVPEAVRKAVAAGDQVSWGWFPSKGESAEASFEVVNKDLASTFASLETGLKGQPSAAVSYLKIQVLADSGLLYAAHREAARLIQKGQGAMRAWAATLDSLDRMGVPKDTLAWSEVQSRIARLSREQRSELFAGADYANLKLVDQLRRGQAGRVLGSLDTQRFTSLAQSVLEVRQVTTEAAAHAARLAERSPASARKLAATLVDLAVSARNQAPQDPDAHLALAHAQVAQARTLRAVGEKVKPDAWEPAVQTMLGSYAFNAADDGRGYVLALRWLREAVAVAPPAERARLFEAAKDVAAKAAAKFPGSPAAAAAAATVALARADVEPPKAAKAALLEGAAILEPYFKSEPVDALVATAHTDLVTVDKLRDLKAGLAYRTEEVISVSDVVRFRVPVGERWVNGKDLPEGYVAFLEQHGSDGGLVRTITVRSMLWGGEDFVFPSGAEAGGENTSLLAKFDLAESRRSLAKVKSGGKVDKVRFSKAFLKTDGYDVAGTDHDGAQRRVRGWAFHSGQHKVSYLVTIEESRGAAEDDPELDVFLTSFADVSPAK